MTRDEVVALIVNKAQEFGLVPWEFLGGAIAESALNPTARRPRDPAQDTAYWPDVSFGLFQQTARWSDEGDHSPRPDNIRFIEELYSDPVHACNVAARKFKAYRAQEATALDAWCRYNWPAQMPAQNPNRGNYANGLAEAQRILEGSQMPLPYNPDAPIDRQVEDWTCSIESAQWLLRSIGRNPDASDQRGDPWMRSQLVPGIVSPAVGLLKGSGEDLAAWLTREYGAEMGWVAQWSWVTFDDVAAGAGFNPTIIGGARFGPGGHWVGVRRVLPDGSLEIANPAPGFDGIGTTLTREQWDARGPWNAIWVDRLSTLPAEPPPVVVPPKPTDAQLLAEVRADLRAVLAKLDAAGVP